MTMMAQQQQQGFLRARARLRACVYVVVVVVVVVVRLLVAAVVAVVVELALACIWTRAAACLRAYVLPGPCAHIHVHIPDRVCKCVQVHVAVLFRARQHSGC